MASISKTIRPKRSNNSAVSPAGYGLTVGRGTPTATGVDGAGTVLLTETFADSNFAARGWYSIISSDRVASPAPSGLPGSLRMTWNAGQTLPSSGGMRHAFTATDRLYIKYQQSFSANWVGSGQASHPHLVMCLSDQDGAFDGLSDNYLALYTEVNYQAGNRPRMNFQDSRYIDENNIGTNPGEARATCGANGQQGYADSWDLYTDGSASHGWYNARNLSGPVVMAPANTAWHTVECEVILNSVVGGIGQLDGICRYWWDGALVWERTNLIMRTGTRPNLRFNQFLFTPYIGGGSPATQTTYIADLTVATARTSGGTPPASVAVTGTATSNWYESEVVTGGDTMILTVTNDTWVAAGAAFDAQRQNILNGITAASSPTNGWNNRRSGLPVTNVVRTSSTVVTITLSGLASYSVAANEVLTVTVPATALSGGNAVAALPTLTIAEGSPPSGSPTWLANKPATYTTQLVGDFNCSANLPAGTIGSERNIPGTDWTVIYDRDNGGGVSSISRQTDATAPQSPSDVWRWYQPAGTYSGGTGFGNLFAFLPGGTTKVYTCWAMKLSAGYYVHPVSNKLFECFNSGGGDVMVQLGRSGNYFEAYDQNTDTVYPQVVNRAPVTNTWFQVEVQVERGNPGVFRVWVDGELRVNVTAQAVAAGTTFETVGLYMHMGGGGFSMGADQQIWVDHISVYTE